MNQDKLSMKVVPGFGRRLYMTDGMIPKYTGYVPRKFLVIVMSGGALVDSLYISHKSLL